MEQRILKVEGDMKFLTQGQLQTQAMLEIILQHAGPQIPPATQVPQIKHPSPPSVDIAPSGAASQDAEQAAKYQRTDDINPT